MALVRGNGMCLFADATGAGPGRGSAANTGGGSIVLSFAWDPPKWASCMGLDRGVRADAEAREAQTAHPHFLLPSLGLFRAKRSQAGLKLS